MKTRGLPGTNRLLTLQQAEFGTPVYEVTRKMGVIADGSGLTDAYRKVFGDKTGMWGNVILLGGIWAKKMVKEKRDREVLATP